MNGNHSNGPLGLLPAAVLPHLASVHKHQESDNVRLIQTILEQPMQIARNVQLLLLCCILVFSVVIWLVQRELLRKHLRQRRPHHHNTDQLMESHGGTRARTESNMSSSMDENSYRSYNQQQQRHRRSKSREFFLSPVLSKLKSEMTWRSEMRSEVYRSLHWAEEEEDQTTFFRRRAHLDEDSSTMATAAAKNQTIHRGLPQRQQDAFTSTIHLQQSPLNFRHRPASHPNHTSAVVHYGPHVTNMTYHTWTPPPSWTEAARRVFPRDVKTLRRVLKMDVFEQQATLTISENVKSRADTGNTDVSSKMKKDEQVLADFCMPVSQFSVHPTPPTEGVLELYVKNSPKSQWMEHTFSSAQAAAQFQTDLLAAQILGPSISNMFHVFCLIHQGSMAHPGPEFVWHDRECDDSKDNATAVGVAWDDLMRCFGSTFPRIRMQLENLWWHGTKPKGNANETKATSAAESPQPNQTAQASSIEDQESPQDGSAECSAEYTGKRLLLGPVDFFRLFVPTLPQDALPYTSSDVKRMEQLLRWRKRVARASLLLKTYARARQIVNTGWNLGADDMPDDYLKFRLSYDMNIDNHARDSAADNEYYEPYVSRDVFCRVRGVNFSQRKWWNFLRRRRGESVISLGQTFSLVRSHVFRLPPQQKPDDRMNPKNDLVQSICSLRELVENNSDVDFMVWSLFNTITGIVLVNVYARNTPTGVDVAFDRVWDKFKASDEETRRRKLELMFQLDLMTFVFPLLQKLFLKIFALMIWLLDVEGFVAQSGISAGDRSSLPPMRLEDYGHTYHFGGSLATNRNAPTNYVSANTVIDQHTTMAGRLITSLVYTLRSEIGDIMLKIKGEDETEFPERILACQRLVKTAMYRYALPLQMTGIGLKERRGIKPQLLTREDSEIPTIGGAVVSAFLVRPCREIGRATLKSFGLGEKTIDEPTRHAVSEMVVPERTVKPSIFATSDPFEKAVNKLIELLEDVRIPARVEDNDEAAYLRKRSEQNVLLGGSPSAYKALEARGDLRQVSILEVLSRSDLLRYFVASECSLKKATVRIVESAAWRGLTFPIDIRACRVELQTGQFFQQGRDLEGRPIFYFRNMCKGPWRGDEDAVIAAVIHRLEKGINEFAKENANIKCILVVLMGKPKTRKRQKKDAAGDTDSNAVSVDHASTANQESSVDQDGGEAEVFDNFDDGGNSTDGHFEDGDETTSNNFNNPRVPVSERLFSHSNERVARRLVRLVMMHYPERLHRCFVVKGHGGDNSPHTVLGSMVSLSHLVDSSNTRRKVKFFRHQHDLQKYVDKNELIQLVGGDSKISPSAFEDD